MTSPFPDSLRRTSPGTGVEAGSSDPPLGPHPACMLGTTLRPACDTRRARGTELPGRPAAGRGLLLLRCGGSELCRLAWASGLGPGAPPETCDATEQQPPRTLAVRLPGLWVRISGQGWYAADGPSVLLGHHLNPSPGVGSAGQCEDALRVHRATRVWRRLGSFTVSLSVCSDSARPAACVTASSR